LAQENIIYNEDELVFLLQQGSKDAFNYLYANYSAALWTTICRLIKDQATAEDVLQEAFVKIWKGMASYNSSKGRLYTWMCNITRNCAIDKLRSKGERMNAQSQNNESIVHHIAEMYGAQQNTDTIGLKAILAQLPQMYLLIVDLAYFKGYTMEECAEILEIPVGTVKTRLRKAISLLREKLNIA